MFVHHINIQSSRILRLMIISVTGLTMVILVMSRMPLPVKLTSTMASGCYGLWLYYRYCGYSSRIIQAITRQDVGLWALQSKEASCLGKLMGDSVITSYVMILRFKVAGDWLTKSLVLFPDAMSQSDFRRLRVTIKLDH